LLQPKPELHRPAGTRVALPGTILACQYFWPVLGESFDSPFFVHRDRLPRFAFTQKSFLSQLAICHPDRNGAAVSCVRFLHAAPMERRDLGETKLLRCRRDDRRSYSPYGNICIVFALSPLLTSVTFFSFRIRFAAFVPKRCRLPECIRKSFPVAVSLNRFAAPRCVFNFFFGFDALRGIALNSLLFQIPF